MANPAEAAMRQMPEPVPTRNWQGIICPDPPPMRHDWHAILIQARSSLKSRETHFPNMIEYQKITPDQAEAELEIWGVIVSDWAWITKQSGDAAPRSRWPEIRAQIEKSLSNLADIARENGQTNPLDPNLSEQANRLIAMLWNYESPPNQGRAHSFSRAQSLTETGEGHPQRKEAA